MMMRPDDVMLTSSMTQPDDVMLSSSGLDLYPTRFWTRFRPPRLLTARAGAPDVRFGRSWYRCARIKMLYNVVYLFYMFEAVTDLKIRKELNVRVFFLVFFACFLVFLYGFGNMYDSSHVYHHIRTM